MPGTDLDFQAMMLHSRWGSPELNPELKNILKHTRKIKMLKGSILINEKNEKIVLEEDTLIPTDQFLWNELGMFTTDFRLGKLDKKDYKEAKYWAKLAFDCLHLRMYRAFTVAMSRLATLLELSQSVDGYLRELMGKRHNVEEKREIQESPNVLFAKKNKGGA